MKQTMTSILVILSCTNVAFLPAKVSFIASSREILTILIRDTDVIFKFFFLVTISKKLSQLVIQYNYYLNYFVASGWNLNYN